MYARNWGHRCVNDARACIKTSKTEARYRVGRCQLHHYGLQEVAPTKKYVLVPTTASTLAFFIAPVFRIRTLAELQILLVYFKWRLRKEGVRGLICKSGAWALGSKALALGARGQSAQVPTGARCARGWSSWGLLSFIAMRL